MELGEIMHETMYIKYLVLACAVVSIIIIIKLINQFGIPLTSSFN